MDSTHVIRRTLAAGAFGAALVVFTTQASAGEGKRAICTRAYSAYKKAIELDHSGQRAEARELLSTCVEATVCGGLVPKCTALRDKIAVPSATVVPVVTDESGSPHVDIQVKVDGEVLTSKLDGVAVPVAPGLREFTFSTESGVFATKKVQIVEGQRNRLIEVSMGAARVKAKAEIADSPDKVAAPEATSKTPAQAHEEPATPPREEAVAATAAEAASSDTNQAVAHHASALPYVLGGVGLGALAAGGVLTYWGNKDNSMLQDQCKPNCNPASVDHIRTMYIAADISFGVGAAALLTTGWLLMTHRSAEQPHPQAKAYRVDVQPTRSGAFASVSGAF